MDQQNGSKPNLWMAATFILIGVIVGFGISQIPYFKGTTTQVATIQKEPDQKAAAQQPGSNQPRVLSKDQMDKLLDGAPVSGDSKAPVTIVEFSDFQCPYCSKFVQMTLNPILEDYVKTGKVKVAFRNFPLDGHSGSMPAALAASCANEQNKFWEMHDLLFIQQADWSGSEKIADVFKGYAKKLGLDATKFSDCYKSQKYATAIRKELIDGVSVGVNGTPSFFINGKDLSGAMPYDTVFKPIIDAELAGKQWELQFAPSGQPSVKVF